MRTLLLVLLLLHGAAARATEVRIAEQFGIPYLPLLVMKQQHLLEAEAVRAGLPAPTVTWSQFGNGAAMNDALLSGSLDIAASGTTVVITLWDRTRANLKVRALAAVSGIPYKLVTTDPAIHSIRDFTERDRIALPAAKVSFQAVLLQMAAEREWGPGQQGRLDPLSVSLSHPDAMVALLGGRSGVTAHFGNPPFQELELARPGTHAILSSFDVVGPHSALLAYAGTRFHDANPGLVRAFVAALDDACRFITAHPHEAAELYAASERSGATVPQIEAVLRDPDTHFAVRPRGIEPFLAFQHRIGTIKQQPDRWEDLFFPEVFDRPAP